MPNSVRVTDEFPASALLEALELASDQSREAENILIRIGFKLRELAFLEAVSPTNTSKTTFFLGEFNKQQSYMLLDKKVTVFFILRGGIIYLYDFSFGGIDLPDGSRIGGPSGPVPLCSEALNAISDSLDNLEPEARGRALAWLHGASVASLNAAAIAGNKTTVVTVGTAVSDRHAISLFDNRPHRTLEITLRDEVVGKSAKRAGDLLWKQPDARRQGDDLNDFTGMLGLLKHSAVWSEGRHDAAFHSHVLLARARSKHGRKYSAASHVQIPPGNAASNAMLVYINLAGTETQLGHS